MSGASSLGLPEALNGTDDFESALALAESLAQSKSTRARMFAANLYSTMFRCGVCKADLGAQQWTSWWKYPVLLLHRCIQNDDRFI